MDSGSRNERAMMDWDLIIENIQNAMQAVDKAHKAGEKLRNEVTPDTFDEFKAHMQELCEHLQSLKNAMEHSSTYTMDEPVDVLSLSSQKRAETWCACFGNTITRPE